MAKLPRFWLCVLVAVFLYLIVGVSFTPVFASSPRRYYDWSSTIETARYTAARRVGPAVAGEATPSAVPMANTQPPPPNTFLQFNRYLVGGGLLPDSPFYFIKTVQETVQFTLTFDSKAKEEMRLALAGERLSEMQELADKGKVAGMATAANNYEQTMEDAAKNLEALKNQNQNIDDLVRKVGEETAKHNVVLETVAVQVPPAAKDAVEGAVAAGELGIDTVADLTGRPAVPPDVVDRITALKAQGLLSAEEANKLINLKKRTEAREELRKYVNEGVLPQADLLRMNETMKQFYPLDFYKIHEVKRFYELKKLETEKPPENVQSRIQEFAKTYKPGETTVPPDLRRYWGPIVRLEEMQNTLRPDFIDPALFKYNADDDKKFKEIVERYKPRPEDIAFLSSYLAKNSQTAGNLPPEYARMQAIGEKYGAACGTGQKWFVPAGGYVSGYCVPENFDPSTVPVPSPVKNPINCNGSIVSAKGPRGACSAYPSDCVPAGWTRVQSCVETPTGVTATSTGPGVARISCPSNSHFVSVYGPDSGYCVPNYTPTGDERSDTGMRDVPCPVGYHRNYPGGACLPDTSYTTYYGAPGSLPPLTATPGPYPSPFYPPSSSCGPGYHWVPEPINPRGGYCSPDTYTPPSSDCGPGYYRGPGGFCTLTSKSQEASDCMSRGKYWNGSSCQDTPVPGSGSGGTGFAPKPEMGNCTTPASCYDWCKANPGKCTGFNLDSPRPSEMVMTRESQEATCRAGAGTCTWQNDICNCQGYRTPTPGTCQAPSGGCGSSSYWDSNSCTCRPNGSYPSSCAYPSGGCPSGRYWDSGTCTCATSCPAGSAWNGSYCMPNSGGGGYSSGGGYYGGGCQPPYGGCGYNSYWDNASCMCRSSSYTPSYSCQQPSGGCPSGSTWSSTSCSCYYPPTLPAGGSGGGGGSCQPPSTACPSNQYFDWGACACRDSGSSYTPPSGYGSCSSGQYWNGSNCVSSTSSGGSTSMSPEEACRRGTNCNWTGSSCQCTATQTSPAPTPAPSPSPEPTPTPTP